MNAEHADKWRMEAVARHRAGDYAGALAAAEAALAADRSDLESLHLKAIALGRLGRIDAAREAFLAVAARHPQKGAVLSNYGNALRQAGRSVEAIAAYREAIAADPRLANAWLNLGIVLHAVGRDSESETALKNAIALDPTLVAAWTTLGAVKARAEVYEEALACFDRALGLNPRHASAQIHRGRTLALLGRTQEALVALAPLAAGDAGPIEAIYQHANALRLAGRLAEAAADYRRVLAREPSNIDAHRDLARLLWETGDKAGFLSDLDAALALGDDARLLALRGDLAFRAGRIDVAEDTARRLVKLAPADPHGPALLSKARRAAGDWAAALYHAERAYLAASDDFSLRHQYAEELLAARDFATTRDLLAVQAPKEHLQKHIALRALALRALGDADYRRWYDYDRLTAQIEIDPPAGYASVDAFNADFALFIQSLHGTQVQPIDQTLFGGTQSFGRLWSRSEPIVAVFREAMLKAARRYVESLPDDPDHEFLARKSTTLVCAGAWSVVLSSGGGHVDHIHPAGWISASYYVAAPAGALGPSRDGHLRLGASGVAGLDLPAERYFAPKPGSVVFFPSYIWHGVDTFRADAPRITAPFDLAPANP